MHQQVSDQHKPPPPIQAGDVFARAFDCDADLSTIIAAKATFQDYSPRATILSARDKAPLVHVVIRGQAHSIALAIDGRMILVADFRSGDMFGEAAVLSAYQTADDVVAVDLVRTGRFGSATFIGLIENYPRVALAVSRRLTERLSVTTRRMVEGATLSAGGRIHAELLRLARAGEGMTITPAPVFTEFALRVHSTRETVSRAINALEKRGIVRRSDVGMTIVAPHRLEELIY